MFILFRPAALAAALSCLPHVAAAQDRATDAGGEPSEAEVDLTDPAPSDPPPAAPPPFVDFTFKSSKPPAAGTKRRITVQIEPGVDPDPAPAEAPVAPSAPADDPFAWFWTDVSPDFDGGAERLVKALELVEGGTGGGKAGAPPLDALTGIAATHGRDILAATAGTEVSPALVLAVISVESGGRPTAVSPKGAQGIMQLMPDTADRFGVRDASDAPENIRGGVAYLNWLMGHFDRDPILALAGYNAGEGAVRTHAGVPPFAETRAYVPKVLAAWQVARALCTVPPVLLSDGCVFVTDRG